MPKTIDSINSGLSQVIMYDVLSTSIIGILLVSYCTVSIIGLVLMYCTLVLLYSTVQRHREGPDANGATQRIHYRTELYEYRTCTIHRAKVL